MKLTLLAVGKLKDDWAVDGCAEYEKRLKRHSPIESIEVRDDKALLARVPAPGSRARVIALDVRGDELSSEELAERVQLWQRSGATSVCFFIGGADGLPADLVKRADERISLGRMTLPHRIARLVLLEQLYRAFSIVRGEPYHRA